jgi:hypothetical protein
VFSWALRRIAAMEAAKVPRQALSRCEQLNTVPTFPGLAKPSEDLRDAAIVSLETRVSHRINGGSDIESLLIKLLLKTPGPHIAN